MLKYKILKNESNVIQVPLEMKNIDISSPSNDFEIKNKPIISYEKNGYINKSEVIMDFYFYDGIYYKRTLETLFDFSKEINKNVFKKSNIVLEFYEQGETFSWIGSESIPLTSATYKPPRTERVKVEIRNGFKFENRLMPQTFEPSFKISTDSTFMNELFFYRNFNDFKDIVDGEARIYMRAILQNAKTGERIYFVNGNDGLGTIFNNSDYTFYQEIRCLGNQSYYFIHNGNQIQELRYKEMIGR